jgi:hypothetical protein
MVTQRRRRSRYILAPEIGPLITRRLTVTMLLRHPFPCQSFNVMRFFDRRSVTGSTIMRASHENPLLCLQVDRYSLPVPGVLGDCKMKSRRYGWRSLRAYPLYHSKNHGAYLQHSARSAASNVRNRHVDTLCNCPIPVINRT